MKTTRRSLLQMLGLGAAAAALAPVKAVEAVHVDGGNVGITPPERMLSNDLSDHGYGPTLRLIQPGEIVDPDEIQQFADLLNGDAGPQPIRIDPRDDTAYLQGMIDRGEHIIGGEYYISRPLNMSGANGMRIENAIIRYPMVSMEG